MMFVEMSRKYRWSSYYPAVISKTLILLNVAGKKAIFHIVQKLHSN